MRGNGFCTDPYLYLLKSGSSFNRTQIVCCRVGSGTFSSVFKAVSASRSVSGVHSTVAVKVISMQVASASKLSCDCVVSEIRILKNLKHRFMF